VTKQSRPYAKVKLCGPRRRINEMTIAAPRKAKMGDMVDDDESIRSALLRMMKGPELPVARLRREGGDGSTTER
jgi:hypothetical protein